MEPKTILVHLTGDATDAVSLDVAAALATSFQARLVGLHVFPVFRDPLALVTAPVQAAYEEKQRVESESIEANFEKFASGKDLSHDFSSQRGDYAKTIARRARYADLVVISQADPGEKRPHGYLVGELALTSGRPVLAVPMSGQFATVGDRVLVAWDGGRAAARAVVDALPILEKAKDVIVMCINPAEGEEASADDVVKYLAERGVKAKAETRATSPLDVSVAEVFLTRAKEGHDDLIVMGAYGHSRFFEYTFGGVTDEVLRHATIPVLLSH